jgi:hypothetical protein
MSNATMNSEISNSIDESEKHKDVFDALLRQLEHEDSLLVDRTGWLLTAQSFLLVGFFTIDPSHLQAYKGIKIDFFVMIGILGLLSSAFILSAVLAAVKVFIEVRTEMHDMLSVNPRLRARKLPRYGVGSGLLCPILLSIVILFIWSLLTLKSWLAASLMGVSGSLFSIYIIGLAHQITHQRTRVMVTLCLPIGICALVAALSWSFIHPDPVGIDFHQLLHGPLCEV